MDNVKPSLGLPPEIGDIIKPKIRQIMKDVTNKNIALKQNFFHELNQLASKGEIVFAGDSITEGYQLHEFFPGIKCLYNRGIGGATSTQLLDRIDAHIIDLEPSKLFLLIGINDLANNCSVEETADNVRLICKRIVEACPCTKIYVLSVYPVDTSLDEFAEFFGPTNRTTQSVCHLNELIKENSESIQNTTYLDIYHELSSQEGSIVKEYTVDGIHLSAAGYRKVSSFLAPFVEE
jgi:lysophospholipase L1-like esterase